MSAENVKPAVLEDYKPSNLWLDAIRRLMRNRGAMISVVFLVLIILCATFAEWVAPYDPNVPDFAHIRETPSVDHILGTDELGRDVLSRIIYGARISLFVGIVVQTAAAAIGLTMGLVAGYYGGVSDTIIMRAVDIMYAFPNFLFAVFMVSLLTPNMRSVIFTLTLVGWPFTARLVRGQVLTVKKEDYVIAAQSIGLRDWQIILHYILPNVLTPIIIQYTLGIASVIMAEAGLSFLGIGIRPPTPTWGGMITKGREFFRSSPHLALYPSIVLGLTMLAINFMGDGLRDALDPRMKR
ncbi:ABC transporter permease [Chloroflexota bacterium]